MTETHYRTCSLCEAMCGLIIEHEGGKILSVKGDPDDPHSFGNICPKGVAIQDLHNDPDRLKRPVRRDGDKWVEMDWDEALDEVAGRLVDIQKQYGADAVGAYFGNPSVHNIGTMLGAGPFMGTLKTRNFYTATSVDQLPHQLVQLLMYGHNMLFPVPDIDRTDYMLMLGANPAASNGSLWSAGDVLKRMRAVRERGGKIVLIDPRRTETARHVAEHHFITPGTDAVFLLAILRIIFERGLAKPDHLIPIMKGWDEIEPLARAFTLEEAAGITGIAGPEIARIALQFASAKAAICYGRMGVSTQAFGALCQWLIQVLNIATGNLDRPGGMMFSKPAIDMAKSTSRGSFDSYRSRVRGLPEFGRQFPVATLADEMLTPGDGQIKALVTNAGNPVLSTPNGRQLERALEGLEFMVSIDFYINETTRHAHIILPPTGPLEHEHYDAIFNLMAVRDVTKYSPPMVPQPPGTRSDWQIFRGLIGRINRLKGKKHSAKAKLWAALQRLFPYLGSIEFVLDVGLRLGPYGKGFMPFRKGLSLAHLKRHPHGIDVGALKPALPGRLFTDDKMIDAAPKVLAGDVERLRANFADEKEADGQLLLIGRRHLRSNNSWMHNSRRLVKGKDRCTIMIHPEDAMRRQI
ncbi:MAG: molybdopterin-dependent oxidoreductase, partial [Sphingomonadales bacterium]